MDHTHTHFLKLLLFILVPLSFIIFIFFYLYIKKHPSNKTPKNLSKNQEINLQNELNEQLICFQGGEDLTIPDILDAPGEVIGKSSYGTLYMANLSSTNNSILLLRFLRPVCSVSIKQVISCIQNIGFVRHSNLVPLHAFYAGPRGEKLLVHPFYVHGNLAHFIFDGSNECRDWEVIYSICLGLVKGLAHLHTGLHKPIIHGNLKSQNVLLGRDLEPYICDYGLHLLLNATAGQEMLEFSASQGYKAPELMKMKDVNESTDIYSLGIILLELVTGKEPINTNPSDSEEFYLPNFIRRAILDHRIHDLYHPDIVINQSEKQKHETEDHVLRLVQLAMACCSPAPSLRPHASEVVRKVEDIGK